MTACNSKSDNKNIENISVDSSKVQVEIKQQDSIVIEIDTIIINDNKYIQILKDSLLNCLLSIDGDTIVKSEDYYFRLELIDIDVDGYNDMRIHIFCNTPNVCDNYLFVKKTSSFKLIENCYLDIKKVKGADFFYSYNRAGCADKNWESNLSKIENYKLINYGYIHGQGCDFKIEENPQIIEIYKVNNLDSEEKTLLKKLPYKKYIKEFGDKWDFIENYWTKNYKTFEQ